MLLTYNQRTSALYYTREIIFVIYEKNHFCICTYWSTERKINKKERMKINSIHQQFDKYQTNTCFAKAVRWNNLKQIKNQKNILIKNRIWVTKYAIILYHLCFIRHLDINFIILTWVYCVLILYYWTIEIVIIKLYRMNYKVVKLRVVKQLWSQCFSNAHTLKFINQTLKKEINRMSQWL